MKFRAVLAGLVLMAGSAGYAQQGGVGSSPAPTPKGPSNKSLPPAPARKKEEPKIEGMTLNRPNGSFMGFNFVGNNVVLTFYDEKKKKVKANVNRAIVRWEMKRKTGTDQLVLTPTGDGSALTAAKIVPPPHTLRFTLLLFVDGNEQSVESQSFMYQEKIPEA